LSRGLPVLLALLSLGAAPRPNLLLLTVESLRADHLGCYAGSGRSTPGIDALAARGIRFERVYAASPSTAPSIATILTGLLPAHHGLRHDGAAWLRSDVPTLATLLSRAGYRTGAVVGSFHLDSDRGLDRGFSLYDDGIKGLRKLVAGLSKERRAEEVAARGIEFLRQAASGQSFFLWLDFYDPHYDYEPAGPSRPGFPQDPYVGEVAAVDGQIALLGQTLRTLGLENRTDVVLAASHGEGLGDHGETGHGIYLYETTIRVPLIYAPAGGAAERGRVEPGPVGLVDLAPTLLRRAGLALPPGLDGRPLAAVVPAGGAGGRNAGGGGDGALFVESVEPFAAYGWSPMFALIQGERKIVAGRRVEAFDLTADPGEAKPLAPAPSWAPDLERRGRDLLGSLDPPAALRREVLAKAADLALPWRDQPFCLEKVDLPDPRDRQPLNDALFRARVDQSQGILGRAERTVREQVLPSDASNAAALEIAAELALRNGDEATLLERLAVLQCDYPLRAPAYHLYGHQMERKRDRPRAEAAFKIVSLIEPRGEESWYDLAGLYALEGKKDLALGFLKKSIQRGATDFEVIRSAPQFTALRDDPRFKKLVGETGPPKPGAPSPGGPSPGAPSPGGPSPGATPARPSDSAPPPPPR
jgi:choline-sulfatase